MTAACYVANTDPGAELMAGQVLTLDRQTMLRATLRDVSVPLVPSYIGDGEVRFGTPINPVKVRSLSTFEERITYLAWRIFLLAERPFPQPVNHAFSCEVVAPGPTEELQQETARLVPLFESGMMKVFLAEARQIPASLREIGRLREVTFRAAGEGTGDPLDIDLFDEHYLHLFIWNAEKAEIVGAYRLSPTDHGPDHLYTATLFHYGQEFLSKMGPALELGRSFVRKEYQRSFSPLLLLWKGIGKFLAVHPQYRRLFGPVSISSRYSSLSRELMIAFLERREWLAGLASLVRPRRAPARQGAAEYCYDLEDLSDVISDVECRACGVPVLLRHYLRLGGKLLGFNVDHKFSDALDGLMLVDLTQTEPALLERYLGKPEAQSFRDYWKGKENGTI